MDRWGVCFEQAIALEINAYLSYSQKNYGLNYWRTETGIEVDFILDGRVGIEVKSAEHTSNRDHKNLLKLRDEGSFERLIVVNAAQRSLEIDGVSNLSLIDFVKELWNGEIV
jgi:uncharacterized protein